jgi:malonyl CoA-acyl carrier protein transacylase
MGRDDAQASPAARAVFESADAALGFGLSRLCFEGPEEELRRTEIQQPAILTASVALLRALEERTPVAPAYVAGHSLGEYSALVAVGALDFEDAVRLVHARGRFMQEAVPEGRGAMAAVMGCGPEVVLAACEHAGLQTGRVVAPANYNGPAQTVISGDAAAVEAACTRARQEGAKRAVALDVSAPFHLNDLRVRVQAVGKRREPSCRSEVILRQFIACRERFAVRARPAVRPEFLRGCRPDVHVPWREHAHVAPPDRMRPDFALIEQVHIESAIDGGERGFDPDRAGADDGESVSLRLGHETSCR